MKALKIKSGIFKCTNKNICFKEKALGQMICSEVKETRTHKHTKCAHAQRTQNEHLKDQKDKTTAKVNLTIFYFFINYMYFGTFV